MASERSSNQSVVYKPPQRHTVNKPSVILYGNIDLNAPVDWRNELASSLSDLPVVILNPQRDDWDSSWIEDIAFPGFKEQVEWEMDYAKVADVIAFQFTPSSLAPIALLELGMYAGTGKVVVYCHPEFKKRGNVQMVCLRYGIELTENKSEFKENVRQRLMKNLNETSGSTT